LQARRADARSSRSACPEPMVAPGKPSQYLARYLRLNKTALEKNVSIILSWLVLSFAVWVTDAVLPGFHVKGVKSALLVAAIFGVLNFLLGWLLFAVFTVVTLGLAWLLAFITRWIINAILLVLTDKLTDHLKIDSFGWALLGSLMMSAIGTLGEWVVWSVF
jgi:putative membrane protein